MVPILYAWITSSTWLLSVFQANTYENKCRWWNQKFYFSKFIKQLFLLLDLVQWLESKYHISLFYFCWCHNLNWGEVKLSLLFFKLWQEISKQRNLLIFAFRHWLIQCKKQILPLLELAIVEAIASCVASVTTDTSKGEVQSEKKKSYENLGVSLKSSHGSFLID